MKKAKRVISGVLTAALVVSGMTGIAAPVRAEAAAPETLEEFKEQLTPVDGSENIQKIDGTGNFKNGTVYLANGAPVTIREEGGTTYLFEDGDADVKVALNANDAVFGGGYTGSYDSTQITMESGRVSYLIGGGSGTNISSAQDSNGYSVGRAEINLKGGTVGVLAANMSLLSGDGSGLYENRSNQMVAEADINVSGGNVTYLYGCFGYTKIDSMTVDVTGDARVEVLLPGATNGELGNAEVTVDGDQVEIGEIAGCQRTLVNELILNLNAGTVERAISVGSLYNSSELMSEYGNNPGQFGNMHYGVVNSTTLTIEKGFHYQGVWGGMQFMPEEVKAFKTTMANASGNQKSIIETYYGDLDPDTPIETSARLSIKEAPESGAKGSYKYLYDLANSKYEGTVPNLLTDEIEGVEIDSAPASISLELEDKAIEVGDVTVATASVAMIAPVYKPKGIQWSSSDESVAGVYPTDEEGVVNIKGFDIGSAVITASFECLDTAVEAKAPISVGGEFDISVSPSPARLGNTVTFSAGTKAARTASPSVAEYSWEISDSSVAEIIQENQKTMKAKVMAVGDASAKLTFTDENGHVSEGSAALTVMPPTAEIDAKSSAKLGSEVDVEVIVRETDGSNEDLGIETWVESLDGSLELVEQEGDTYTWMVVDVPASGAARVTAEVSYPSTTEVNSITASADIAIENTVYNMSYDLEPGDGAAVQTTLPSRLRELAEDGYLFVAGLESAEEAGLVVEDRLEDDGSLRVSLAEGVAEFDQAQLRVVTASGYTVAIYTFYAPSLNAEATDGGIEIVTNVDQIEIEEASDEELTEQVGAFKPAMPEGTELTEADYNRQVAQALNDTLDGVGSNTAIAEDGAVSNLGQAVLNAGMLANEEKAMISLEQTLDDVELAAETVTDENGVVTEIRIVPAKLVFQVEAFKQKLDENGDPIEGTIEALDLSADRMDRRHPFQFRLPIPENVDKTYANVEHEGDSLTQYSIEGSGAGKYITVTTWHLSQFTLTFTNEQLRTSGRSGGSGGGGSINTRGTWILDEIGWWYRNPDGKTWPSNCWIKLEWDGVRSWYRFNEQGYMVTGWYTDSAGNTYFLHDVSDGTMGHMYTGWHLINGLWYYFETEGDLEGRLYRSTTTPDGYQVDESGVWIQ